jgi:hypothetical protein
VAGRCERGHPCELGFQQRPHVAVEGGQRSRHGAAGIIQLGQLLGHAAAAAAAAA